MVIVSGVSISPGQKSSMRVVTSVLVTALVSVTNGSLSQDKWWPRGVTLRGLCCAEMQLNVENGEFRETLCLHFYASELA